jgi:hypothetical protein
MASILNGTKDQTMGEQMQNMAQIASGAMQIAQGLLGMMAAGAEAEKGNTGNQRVAGYESLNNPYSASNYNPSSPNGGSTNNTDLGQAGSTGNAALGNGKNAVGTIAFSNLDLRSGDIGKAMDGIEKNFGIPRDKFADLLKAGVNPKDILANAPKNSPSMDLLNKIEAGLAANNTAAQDAANRIIASAGGISNAGLGSSSDDKATEQAKGVKPVAAAPVTTEEELDINNPTLSPEVKAAMAAKIAQNKADKERGDSLGWNIFQLVHHRYQKLETMLYGRVERTNPNPANAIR